MRLKWRIDDIVAARARGDRVDGTSRRVVLGLRGYSPLELPPPRPPPPPPLPPAPHSIRSAMMPLDDRSIGPDHIQLARGSIDRILYNEKSIDRSIDLVDRSTTSSIGQPTPTLTPFAARPRACWRA